MEIFIISKMLDTVFVVVHGVPIEVEMINNFSNPFVSSIMMNNIVLTLSYAKSIISVPFLGSMFSSLFGWVRPIMMSSIVI